MQQNSDPPPGHASQHEHAADSPELDAKVQGLLGRALQIHYDDLVKAPIPDRFLVLLAQLEAKEQRDE